MAPQAMLLLGIPSVPCGDCAPQSSPLNRGCPAGELRVLGCLGEMEVE